MSSAGGSGQNRKTAGIPVIMVTQLFDPADVLRGLEAGADNFIIKPFEPESVFSRISEALHEDSVQDPDTRIPPLDVEFFGQALCHPGRQVTDPPYPPLHLRSCHPEESSNCRKHRNAC